MTPNLTRLCVAWYLRRRNFVLKWLVFVTDSNDFFLPAIMLFSIAKALTESWRWAARSSARRIAGISLPKSVLAIGRLCLRTSLQAQRRYWMSFRYGR